MVPADTAEAAPNLSCLIKENFSSAIRHKVDSLLVEARQYRLWARKAKRRQLSEMEYCRDNSSRQKVHKQKLTDKKWTDDIGFCPTFCPSAEEFDDPLTYVKKISPVASRYGICKIVSPLKVSVPAGDVLMNEKKDFKFTTYVQCLRLAKWNANDKATFYSSNRDYTYSDFERKANNAFKRQCRACESLPSLCELEKKFWYKMCDVKRGRVEYGINIEGSAFSCDPDDELGNSKWNLKTLPRLPQSPLHLLETAIPGITGPMLYIGMLFSMFAWHVEDHYLYSINYHHSGEPKTWYGVPGNEALQFEKVVMDNVYTDDNISADGAFEMLAHKTTMFHPNILLQNGIPVYKAIQMPGEFIITFPRAYHAGFSNGFNCGEAVNFATQDWFPFAAAARWRYARLSKTAILPFEELVCKEAYHLSKFSNDEDLVSCHEVQISAIYLMKFYNHAFVRLKNLLPFRSSPNSQVHIICGRCKRDCYLSYIWCHGYNCPAKCLFHDIDMESLKCSCGNKYIVFQRANISEMQDVAQKFERDQTILEDVQRDTEGGNEIRLPLEYDCVH